MIERVLMVGLVSRCYLPTENDLFGAVDALLEQVPSDALPPPAERRRLREAAGLGQTQIATALGTWREAVGN